MNDDTPLLRRWGQAFLTACVPFMVMLLVLTLQGYRLEDHAPVLGDEIYYWHQAATWARAGLEGGYYVIDQITARAPFAHYYAWGFGPPIFYGMFGRLFGWPLNGILIVNALYFFLSVMTFVLLARLDGRRCVLLAVLLAVYPSILVYLPTSMLEPIYLSAALVVAGGLYRLNQEGRDGWAILLTGAALVLMSLMRFTWALMFWPYLYYLAPWRVWTLRARPAQTTVSSAPGPAGAEHLQGRDLAAPLPGEGRWLWALIGTLVLAGLFFVFYNLTAASYPYALKEILSMIRTEPVNAFSYYISMVTQNVLTYFVPDHLPSLALRFVALGLLLWAVRERGRSRTRQEREALTVLLYIIVSAFVIAVFVYATARSVGFRFFAPYVLMALALCIALSRPTASAARRSGIAAIVTHLGFLRGAILLFAITVPLVFAGSDTLKQVVYRPGRIQSIETYRSEWHSVGMVYVPNTNPWCNTLAYSISYLGDSEDSESKDRLLALDAGMGLSIVWWTPEQPQRARTLMLTEADYQAYPQRDQLTRLVDVPGGAVYRNEAVLCP